MPRRNGPLPDFNATLIFEGYKIRSAGIRAVQYRNAETNDIYQIANSAVERMIKLDYLRPVVIGRWNWTSQGGRDVLRPVTVTYAGLTIPETAGSRESEIDSYL